MRTVELVAATDWTRSKTAAIAADTPRMRSRPWRERNSALSRRFSSVRRWVSRAPRTTIFSSSTSKGFVR
jgi:hypothetical protein